MAQKRVLSGMRPTGRLHLGHLDGALANWLTLSATHECYFFSADWHALTSEYADTASIHDNTREMIADWISVGLNPEKVTLFVQSDITQHAELYLILSMITPLPWALGCPTFKEQQEQILKALDRDEEELKRSVQKRLKGGKPKSGKKW